MNLSLRTWIPVIGLVGVALTTPGCMVEAEGPAAGPEVAAAPPAEQVEAVPPARVGHVWVRGHWGWVGGRYVWIGGRYEPVRAGRAWVEGHWQRRPRGWVWVEGYWR